MQPGRGVNTVRGAVGRKRLVFLGCGLKHKSAVFMWEAHLGFCWGLFPQAEGGLPGCGGAGSGPWLWMMCVLV